VRRDTQNASDVPTSTSLRGIQTKDFVRYFNQAQAALEQRVTAEYPFVFQAKATFDIVQGQAAYTIPDNLYIQMRFKKVEYSVDGQEKNFYQLDQKLDEQNMNYSGRPSCWHRQNGQVVLEPVPSESRGKIRVTYQRALDLVAERAGQITAFTTNANGINGLTLNTATDDHVGIAAAIVSGDPLCIVSIQGVNRVYNLYFTAYDAATGVVTVQDSGQNVLPLSVAIGDFITLGAYTTTHSKLPQQICENFLNQWVAMRVKIRESDASGWQALRMLVKEAAGDLAQAFAIGDSTSVLPIPIVSTGRDMLLWNRGNG